MKYSQQLAEHVALFRVLRALDDDVAAAGDEMAMALGAGGKLMFCGNGGSAADAQHIAAELTGRYVLDRKPLAAIALTTDTSALTAIANDYSFSDVFARQVEALGVRQDCLIVISTSGNSPNILKAARAARRKGMSVVGLLGRDGGKAAKLCNAPIIVPSNTTARIQEAHGFIGHALCAHIEATLGL